MKKKVILLFAAVLLIVGAIITFISARKNITLIVNEESYSLTTYALTVEKMLAQQGFAIQEEDRLTPSATHWLRKGEKVRLEQAAHFFVMADGESDTILTAKRKPADILSLVEVPLYSGDQVFVDGRLAPVEEALPYQTSYSLQVRRATPIHVFVVDNREFRFTSGASTLAQALWEKDIRLYSSDSLTPAPSTPLTGKPLQARLARSRELAIRLQEQVIHIRTSASTVGAALAEHGLALQGLDYSIPQENAPIPENGEIEVVRVQEKVILEQEPIPFGVKFQPADDIELDTQKIIEGGEYGMKARRVRVRYENGVEVSRKLEKEWTAKEPVSRVIGYGTQIVVRTAQTADGTIEYWRKVEVYATSYSPCRLGVDYCDNITSSGAILQKGVIAVIRSWFLSMRGTPVYVPGYGRATIEDVGGGIAGQHWIDLGYKDNDFVLWHQPVTLYFLTPIPAPENIMWVLE